MSRSSLTERACHPAAGRPRLASRSTPNAARHVTGPSGTEGKYDRLVGGRGTLATDKPVLTIGSFWPYAPTLWSYINRAKPIDEPGSLTPEQVYAVTAYLLFLNGIIAEDDAMDARTLGEVRMPNRDGFVFDPRPDVGRASRAPSGSRQR